MQSRVYLLALHLVLGSVQSHAQSKPVNAVRSVGAGPVTWVLLSGMMGSVSGFRALEVQLTHDGSRVITIDPYLLSIDSTDVSFAAAARRTLAVLDVHGVQRMRLVGHANGAGVALRVAALVPDRVESLFLLDAGALATGSGRVLGQMLRLVPLIAKLPGGRGYLRSKLVDGVLANSSQQGWFDDAARRAYVDPILNEIGPAISLAIRVGRAVEPESVVTIVARVTAPVTVILGDAPHSSEAHPEELHALASLGDRLEIIRLSGIGHFPHEEATALVVTHLHRRRVRPI